VLAGVLIAPTAQRPWRSGAIAAGVGLVLIGGFLFARYGNDRINLFTRGEVATVDRLYELAPQDSVLVSANANLPWQSEEYTEHRHLVLSRRLPELAEEKGRLDLATETAKLIQERGEIGFVVFTRASRAYDDLLGAQEWGSATGLERAIAASPRFRRVYATDDGAIYELREGA
jgi:hypothetical protein